MYNILVCDDEKDIVSALEIYLKNEGYCVLCAYNGNEAVDIAAREDIQLILMDIMMPGTDGIAAMLKIRQNSNVPVIFLTAKSEDTDKILGLNVGADDYITKPFNPIELIARVRSQLRRYTQLGSKQTNESQLQIGGIVLDDGAKTVSAEGKEGLLTPTEFDILKLLMQNAGKVLAPCDIYEKVKNQNGFGAENAIAVHIRHIREKIEINPAEPRYLKVVWAHGYKFEGSL